METRFYYVGQAVSITTSLVLQMEIVWQATTGRRLLLRATLVALFWIGTLYTVLYMPINALFPLMSMDYPFMSILPKRFLR